MDLDINIIRKDFPFYSTDNPHADYVYLDNAATTQKPATVLESILNYYSTINANVHRGNHYLSLLSTEAYENARKKVREFIHASSEEEIVFTRGTTEAINLVAFSFSERFLQPADEVLISGMEHHSNLVPWQLACERKNAVLKVIPVKDDGSLDLEAYASLLTPRTRIVAITHISNTLGTINPVREIIAQAHEKNIPVLIDGAQAAPHLQVDVQELNADFYCFSGHKMFGPTGIGVLYGKQKWLEELPPYQSGGEMIETVTFEKTTFNRLPFKFEAGTPHIEGAIGLKAAIEYVESIGYQNIYKHEHNLLKYATGKLSEIEGLRIIGTAPEKASVISFVIEGIHPGDIGTLLDKMKIAVRVGNHCTEPLINRFRVPGTVRASFAFYNTFEEIDRMVDALKTAIRMLS